MSAEVQPLGWSINDWARIVGCSRALVYELLGDRRINSKKLGCEAAHSDAAGGVYRIAAGPSRQSSLR
jgi:hypothetical protein